MKKNMNTTTLFIVIVAIMGGISCSKSAIIEDPSLQIIFGNNRVVKTELKSIEQTSIWSEGDAFGVYATESHLSTFSYMGSNTKVSFSESDGWKYDNPIYWPTESQQFTFFAYFPYVSDSETSKPLLTDDNEGKFMLKYQVAENVKVQEDLLWDWILNASEVRPCGENTTMGNGKNTSFAFQHSLSRIRFRAQANEAKNIYITSLSLTAYDNGTFSTIRTDGNTNSTTTPTWETTSSLMTFKVIEEFIPNTDSKYGYLVDTQAKDIGYIVTRRNDYDADYESFMIPQSITEVKIKLTYNIVNQYRIGGGPSVKEVVKEFGSIDLQDDWLLGLQYMYYINIADEEATLTTKIGSWNDYAEII